LHRYTVAKSKKHSGDDDDAAPPSSGHVDGVEGSGDGSSSGKDSESTHNDGSFSSEESEGKRIQRIETLYAHQDHVPGDKEGRDVVRSLETLYAHDASLQADELDDLVHKLLDVGPPLPPPPPPLSPGEHLNHDAYIQALSGDVQAIDQATVGLVRVESS
jgi:hypothetical protein